MSEQKEENQKSSGKNQKFESVFARLPNGKYLDLFSAMESERALGEKSIRLSDLKSGDIVGIEYSEDDGAIGQLMFKVDGMDVTRGGINVGAPSTGPSGKLLGFLPPEVGGEHFTLLGSGYGHFTQFGILMNGRSFVFQSDRGVFRTPLIDKFAIVRPDENSEYKLVTFDQLGDKDTKENNIHKERLEKVKELKESFGFAGDMDDCSQKTQEGSLRYEDENYIAEYSEGMALGNVLTVLDKKTDQWMQFGYFNFGGEGTLKVSFSDLGDIDYTEKFSSFGVGTDFIILGLAIPVVTFNSSPNRLDFINYMPGDKDLEDIGIVDYDPTKFRFKGKPTPNIIYFLNGNFTLDSSSFFVPMEESHPGALEKIKAAVNVSLKPDGKFQFNFNNHPIINLDPDTELDKLLSVRKATKDEVHNQPPKR